MKVKLINPLNMHPHLRDTPMLGCVTPYLARDFRTTVTIPNLIPPLCDLNTLKAYKNRIIKVSENELLTPLMTLFFQHYDEKLLEETRNEIFGIKLYPAGITTNPSEGVSSFDLETLKLTLLAMSVLEIPLLVHDETNNFAMDRRANFAKIYEKLVLNFPELKIAVEHTTIKTLCKLLKDYKDLYATITLHHLILGLDGVVGGKMQPRLFCKSITKTYEDREALCKLAFSRYEKAMFGSDSTPHPQDGKRCCGCTAGVFSSPAALSISAELFEKNSGEDSLQKLLSNDTCEIHRLSFQKDKIIELRKEKWQIKENYHRIVSFMAEKCLEFEPFILE